MWARSEGVLALAQYAVASADSPHREEAIHRYAKVWQRVGQTERRLVELNCLYARLVVDELPVAEGALFQETFLALAYPQLFPDPHDLEPVLAAISQCLDAESNPPGVFETIADDYRSNRDALSVKMIRLVDDYMLMLARTRRTVPPEFEEYKATLSKLAAERASLAVASLKRIDSLLSEQSRAQVAPALLNYQNGIRNHRSEERGAFFRP
jgi:hypothetical protein